MHYKSPKEIWDKLQNIHEGDDKVKKAKLQTHIINFESMKIKDEENITVYLLRVDKIVNTIRGLGEMIEESMIVQKVLRSLPLRFGAKVSSIEEIKDLDQLTMDEFHGILTAYEMRTKKEKP
jgi:RNA-binding protein YlmH